MTDGPPELQISKEEKTVYCVICGGHVSLSDSELLPSNLVGLRTVLDQLDISETERSTAFLRAMHGRRFTACRAHMANKKQFQDWPAIRFCRPKRKEKDQRLVVSSFKQHVPVTNRFSMAERVRQEMNRVAAVQTLPHPYASPQVPFPLDKEHKYSPPILNKNNTTSKAERDGLERLHETPTHCLDSPFISLDELELKPLSNETPSHFDSELESLLNSPSMTVPCMWDVDFMQSLQFPAFFPATPDLNAFYDFNMDENSLFHV